MQALAFWKTITMDKSNFLERLIELLESSGVRFAVVGGQAVNAYATPLVSLDLGLAVATEELPELENLLSPHFSLQRFPHSLNVSDPNSGLRVQFQTDPRYSAMVARAATQEVLGLALPVANLEDVLQGKIWAALDEERRASKRQKDLADIARLLEAYPELRKTVPEILLDKLLS